MNRRKIDISVCAKINLSLNILGARGNMHTLDSVMASVGLTDAIALCERLDSHVNVEFSAMNIPKVNSVMRAIDALRREFGDFGVDVFVKKNLPISGGLGGSSADAAGVIVAIDKLFDFGLSPARMAQVAFGVGSDVAYMLEGGFARVLGAGERIEKIDTDIEFFMVITKPKNGVDTGECYKKFDELTGEKSLILCDNNTLIGVLKNKDRQGAQAMFSNALQTSASIILPEILHMLELVQSLNAEKVIMSGSGSCVVGFFGNLEGASEAAEKIKSLGYWAIATSTKKSGINIE